MEIRHRLTLQFTILVAFLLLAILGFNYYLAYIFARESFLDRLRERSITVANSHLNRDQIQRDHRDALDRRYRQVLNGEVVYVFSPEMEVLYSENPDTFRITHALVYELKGQEETYRMQNDRYFIGFEYNDENKDYFIVASAIDATGSAKLRNMVKTMTISFFIFLFFVVLAGQFLSRKALQPIKLVIDQVNSISAENLSQRVQYENDQDEIAQLALTFNSMLLRLEDSFKSQSEFVRNASHELRNPLAAMIGQAEITLNKSRSPEHYQEVLKAIFQEALRLKDIINSLLQLSQASQEVRSHQLEVFRLDELLLDVIENLSRTKNYRQIEVRLPDVSSEEPTLKGIRNLLEVALNNLIENACKYSHGKQVHCILEKTQNELILRIEDQGMGMTPEEIKFFTEPFFRSSRARKTEGFGIGMAIAHKILQLHHIPMDVRSTPGVGTEITLRIQIGTEAA